MHQQYGTLVAQTIEHHQLMFVPREAIIATMSRLNFMETQELVIQIITEELAQLERLVLNGEVIGPENVKLFDNCIAQTIRIRDAINKQADNTPLPDWMRKVDNQVSTSGKKRWSKLAKQA